MGPVRPEEVERFLIDIASQVDRGVDIVAEAEREASEAEREHSEAFAREYLDAKGPQTEKRYKAELATSGLRLRRDVTRLAFAHAQRRLRGLETKLSAYQTVAKSVTAMFGAPSAGRGR